MPRTHLWIPKSTPPQAGPASESSETQKRTPLCLKSLLYHLLVAEACYQRTKLAVVLIRAQALWERLPSDLPFTLLQNLLEGELCQGRGWGVGWRGNALRGPPVEDDRAGLQSPCPILSFIPPPDHPGHRKIEVTSSLLPLLLDLFL